MSASKKSSTDSGFLPREGIKVWLAKVVLGAVVFAIWSPTAVALGVGSTAITVSFIVAYTVFFSTSAGKATERVLGRIIRREG